MELRDYARVLVTRWWLILAVTLIGLTGALIFSYSRTPTYEATSSYIVRLTKFDETGNNIYGMSLLTSSQQRIFATYCQVMTSQAVRDQAVSLIGVDAAAAHIDDYDATCTVLPDTNVLRLTVQGPAPALVKRLNEAIGIEGMNQSQGLYFYFPLDQLDAVSLNETPISPNYSQNGVLGGALGLILGVTLALLVEHLRGPRPEELTIAIPRRRTTSANATTTEQLMS